MQKLEAGILLLELKLTTIYAADKEPKIAELDFPSDNHLKLYDDWYWDITRVLHRKVFIFMHIRTRIGLATPALSLIKNKAGSTFLI